MADATYQQTGTENYARSGAVANVTVPDVTATPTQTTINASTAALSAKLNELLVSLRASNTIAS